MSACPMDFAAADLTDRNIQQSPFAYYDWLRRNEPVHWDAALGAFVVTSNALIRQAALDWETFSNVGTRDFGSQSESAGEAAAIRATTHQTQPLTVVLDPPQHTQYRKIMNLALTQRRMADSKPWVERRVDDLLSALLESGGGDFVEQFSIPLPFAVINHLLGLPDAMAPTMRVWADSYTERFKGPIAPEREIDCARTYVEYHRFFERLIRERRAADNPPDDLVTAIAMSRLDDGRLVDMAEALSLIEQFVTAGAETTMNALSMGAYALANRPQLLDQLRAHPERVGTFTEETLRLFAPAQGLLRVVTRDTELGGVALAKGTRVMLRWGAGNTDPEAFADPLTMDLCRANARQHVTFGYGIHKCQGSPLARIELNAAFAALARRCETIELDPTADPVEHVGGIVFMGLTRLPLRLG